MEIKTGTRRDTLVLTNCIIAGKNFMGRAGTQYDPTNTELSWDRFNEGGGKKRKFRLKLTEEEAQWFASQGGKVEVLPANPPKYPDPAYYIEIRLSYFDKRTGQNKLPPRPGDAWDVYRNGPHIVKVTPGKPAIELTSDNLYRLDEAIIEKADIEVWVGPTVRLDGSRVMREGVPGITLYLNEMVATVRSSAQSELMERYKDLEIMGADMSADPEEVMEGGVPF